MTAPAATIALLGVAALAVAAPARSGAALPLIILTGLIVALYGVYEMSGRQIDDGEDDR